MKALFFLLLAGACAQKPQLVRVPPPQNADSAWAAGRECSGIPDSTAKLEDVKWFKEKGLLKRQGALAQYRWPDSISFEPSYFGVGWIVEHELLHYRLQQTSCDTVLHCEDHPYFPFWFPCKVMYFQQVSGGIMAPHAKP